MCFVWISEQTAIISLYNINWLVCITETDSVYCAVRTSSSSTIQVTFSLGLSSTVTPMAVTKCSHWLFLGFPKACPKVFLTRGKQSLLLVIETARTFSALYRRWRGSCVGCRVPSVADVSKDCSVFIFRVLGPLIFVDVTTSLRKFGEDMQVGLRSVDVTPMCTASIGHAC